jgi:hypothetical protein
MGGDEMNWLRKYWYWRFSRTRKIRFLIRYGKSFGGRIVA